ncbi:MAG TPA: hypothetical protein VGH31_04445 [Acidimicrobiales bacterium]
MWLPLLGAIAWAALLLPGALYLPIGFQQYTGTDPNHTSTVRSTLVQLNGHGILLLVAVPLVLSCLTAASLLLHGKTGWPVTRVVAWNFTGAVLAGAALDTVTFLIGIFVVPAGGLLVVACANSARLGEWSPRFPTSASASPT